MLFAVCREGAEIRDHYGPLMQLLPPRNLNRVRDDEVYVLFDEAPHTYRDFQFAYRRDPPGKDFPQLLDAAAWERIRTTPGRCVRVLMFNGFGGGYGDALVGSTVVGAVYRRIAETGKTPLIDFLIHPYSFERERHFEIYKLNPFINRLHFTTIRLDQFKTYDYYGTSENFVKDPLYASQNVYDYFLAKMGLDPGCCDRQLRLYPDPAVMREVQEAVRPLRADPSKEPILLLNFFATPLRAVPQFKWREFVEEFARDYRLAFTSDADSAQKLREFIAALPPALREKTIDLSGISSKSFDHLIGVLHHGVDAVITPDTSLLHICGGLNKPCVGMFFTIEPFLRCEHYPTVAPYCHPAFRKSRFWGQSKLTEPEERQRPVHEDQEFISLWRQVEPADVREKLAGVLALPARAPCVISDVYTPRSTRPRVLVYTGTTVPGPWDRNDYSALLARILPEECEVEVLDCRPLEFRSLRECNLLIFGLGDCLYEPVLRQPGLVRFIRSARRRIGIFGTQYPDSIPQPVLEDLIGGLDHWFAVHHGDLAKYGQFARNASWLGEWQAMAVPMGRWEVDRDLVVDEMQARLLPWEENVRRMQPYRRVTCQSVHSMLCALGSAEEICCRDPKAYRNQPSRRANNLWMDIFGKPMPEEGHARVDTQRFIEYRRRITSNLATLRDGILEFIGSG